MRRSIAIALLLNAFFLASRFWQELNVHAQEETCSTTNGDVNGDDLLDMSDAIALLHGLFLGGPAPVPTCQSQGRSGVPDTGQHMCHDPAGEEIPCAGEDFRGQDGAYSTGCPSEGRFVDNENGTVTDTCTGLMWQKETADVNSDSQIDERGDRIAWFLALAFCEDLTFADYENWRLPNVRELQSIADYGQEVSPSIDPAFSAVGADYWSSTSAGRFPSAAWTVGFVNGDVITAGKPGRNFVRAVRGGP